ncbi:hypothetical protein TWF718_001246 [Orbilia javanica]|uniref:Uncharacterized protein n=1 Tax=Orbilia javanica TaxID=47235 RepID=A0AAN8RN69_9PEZI
MSSLVGHLGSFFLLSTLVFWILHLHLATAEKETILYDPTWKSMVSANRLPLKYLISNSTVIHKLQAEYCTLGGSEENPNANNPSLTSLISVVGEIVGKLNDMIPLVQSALESVNQGVKLSDLGIAASGPQDLILVSNLRDQLQQYLSIVSEFQASMLIPMMWFYELPGRYRPFLVPSRNISPFLCVIWLCVFHDANMQPIPFPGSNPADVAAASNTGSVTVEVDTDGKDTFKRAIEGLKDILDAQIMADQLALQWFTDNINNERYNFESLLPEWWLIAHEGTIESVIQRIDNWAHCWKIWAPLDALTGLADSITPLDMFLPVNREETKLVARPAEGWPWEG